MIKNCFHVVLSFGSRIPLWVGVVLFTLVEAQPAASGPVWLSSGSGSYQTGVNVTIEEQGDRVPGWKRVVPLSAILSFDSLETQPRVTATFANAVLEGGEPFPLTIHSSSGQRVVDGIYQFSGDYLQELHSAGTQYLFTWTFSVNEDGSLTWEGNIGWAGGHIWMLTLGELRLDPRPRLKVSPGADSSLILAWSTAFPDYVLEFKTGLLGTDWLPVTRTPSVEAGQYRITLDRGEQPRFFRLVQPVGERTTIE